ncbi:MAG: hypothetical protein CMB56_001545 [Methanobacteriota archaeon]|nr:MAG: hypothetical protein CMB56_001545 [Euryarchaeota archaeon]|tara:strand:+ start:2322 stop:3311 length:990 start_codon:yes stop_codon:yes gene_type:complete
MGPIIKNIRSLRHLRDYKNKIETYIKDLMLKARNDGHEEVVDLSEHILLAGGKRIRPMLLILCYEMLGGKNLDEILPLATAYEIIHTATLIHDDINDNAKIRRGVKTIHELEGQAKAQITGDWLFVVGFGLGGQYEKDIVDIMSETCSKMASAELKQIEHIHDTSTTIDDYYSIIEGKTAGPFASGCKAVAILTGQDKKTQDALFNFGMQLGLAFQLVDDLLDLIGDDRLGKPRGLDILEGKMTLPLLLGIQNLKNKDKDKLLDLISKYHLQDLEEILHLLKISGSIDYCRNLVNEHLSSAIRQINFINDNPSKKMVLELAHYVRSRYD